MEVNCHFKTIAKRHNVKSSKKEIKNFHKKGKDYLVGLGVKVLLEASKNKIPKTKVPCIQLGFKLG